MTSIREMLKRDADAFDLLECFYGLTGCETDAFRLLAEDDRWLTVDEVAERIDRERSTTYRAIRRLHRAGLVTQMQLNYEQGGYCHVYGPASPAEIAEEMQRALNEWYACLDGLVQSFRETYDPENGRVEFEDETVDRSDEPVGPQTSFGPP